MDCGIHYGCIFAELPQDTLSDFKIAAFMAGICAALCWFTCMGDDLVLNDGRGFLCVDGLGSWVFVELQKCHSGTAQ